MTTQGLLLAAGAGTRMGRPKALVSDADGSWLERGVRVLDDGGCEGVTVVLGARSSEAVSFLDGLGVDIVIAHDWESGMSASLCCRPAGDAGRGDRRARAPGRPARRHGRGGEAGARRRRRPRLARPCVVRRQPGHPVLLGRDHWAGVLDTATGDRGARDYLDAHSPVTVECGDLATGGDVDSD